MSEAEGGRGVCGDATWDTHFIEKWRAMLGIELTEAMRADLPDLQLDVFMAEERVEGRRTLRARARFMNWRRQMTVSAERVGKDADLQAVLLAFKAWRELAENGWKTPTRT